MLKPTLERRPEVRPPTTTTAVKTKVMTLVEPARMLAGANDLAIVGAAALTVRLAVLDTAPVAAWVLATPDVVLGSAPGMSEVTTTVTVQLALAGMVSPVRLKAV